MIGVITLAYKDEHLLQECVYATLNSVGSDQTGDQDCETKLDLHLVIVDNGAYLSRKVKTELRTHSNVTWLTPTENLGFTGGANLGAQYLLDTYDVDTLVFVNSDAVVEKTAISALAEKLYKNPNTGATTGKVVLYDQPNIINSVGNPVHYSMLSWAGEYGQPAHKYKICNHPTSICGAFFAIRADVWKQLEGFNLMLFAYGEDVELSIRIRQLGKTITYVPIAVAKHDYEFSKNAHKMFLLERNRLINVFTVYDRETIKKLLPGLLAIELGIAVQSVRGHWWKEKKNSYMWLYKNRSMIKTRKQHIHNTKHLPDVELAKSLTYEIQLPENTKNFTNASTPVLLNIFLTKIANQTFGNKTVKKVI